MSRSGQQVVIFGPFRLSVEERSLSRAGRPLPLTPKEFDTLVALVEAEGRVVRKEDLLARVWPDSYVGDGSLARNISVLRKTLGEGVIETLPRRGYRLAAPITATPAANVVPPDAANAGMAVPVPIVADRHSFLPRGRTGIVAAVMLCTVGTAALIWRDKSSPQNPSPTQTSSSIWVLVTPLENRTRDLPNGIREGSLAAGLNRSPHLKVVPTERVNETLALMRRGSGTVLSPEIAREVCLRDGDISLLITGAIEQSDTGYVLTVNVANPRTADTLQIISERAEGQEQLAQAFRSVSEKTRRAAEDDLARLSDPAERLTKVTTASFHALQLYSSANDLLIKNDGVSPPAVNLLKEAVEVDPAFISAQALLVRALENLGRENEVRPYLSSMFENAGAVPDRERYFILGSYYEAVHKPGHACEEYDALVRLYPDHFWALERLASVYRNDLQQPDRAIPYTLRLAELLPNDFIYVQRAWQLLSDVQKNPELAEYYRERAAQLATPDTIERFPYRAVDVLIEPANRLVVDGKPDSALDELHRIAAFWESLQPRGRSALANRMAVAYAALGRINDAKLWLAHAGEGMGYDYAACNIADAEGNYARFLYYLRHMDDRDKANAQVVAALAQLHQVSEAERLFRILEKSPGFASAESHWDRGEIARARGKLDESKRELKDAVIALTVSDDENLRDELPQVAESLADLLESQGDTTGAIEVLEPLASLKLQTFGEFPEYARVLVELSRLYEKRQRLHDREKVDAQLRARFADADPGYFVSQYLRGESVSTARTPELAAAESIRPY